MDGTGMADLFGLGLYQLHKYKVRCDTGALRIMERVVLENDVGRLALNGDGYPYVIPMNHWYHGGRFYWHCAFNGKKIDLILRNPRACYLVDGPVRPMNRGERYYHQPWLSVVCYGQIEQVNDVFERLQVLEMYSRRQGGPSVKIARAKTTNVLVFTVHRMTGRYGRFTPAENRTLLCWDFTETVRLAGADDRPCG